MPQLMPMNWSMSIFMIVVLFFLLSILFYEESSLLFVQNTSEKSDCKNFFWKW